MVTKRKPSGKVNFPSYKRVALDGLVPYARNSRTHSDAQVAQIAASIREYGFTNPVLVDQDGGIIAGHGRVLAARQLGMDEVPVIILAHLTEAQRRAYVIADNKLALNAGWDEELLRLELADLGALGISLDLTGFVGDELAALLAPAKPPAAPNSGQGSLADRFMAVPFSVLNAREGWWQDRKAWWLGLGIQSEVGRGGNLIGRSLFERISVVAGGRMGGGSTGTAYSGVREWVTAQRDLGLSDEEIEAKAIAEFSGPEKEAQRSGRKAAKAYNDHEWVAKVNGAEPAAGGGTSIFDPVLTELAYRWFCPDGGLILDPFAGGSVRGVVASRLGRPYIGHELREEQVEANRAQAAEICAADPHAPTWIAGDSRTIDKTCAKVRADFLFSCPPYADLEVYSDDPADLSAMDYPAFLSAYREIIGKSCGLLRNDRFACFVVGDVRAKDGSYRNFVGDTVQAFLDAGLRLYNEAILITAVGSLAIRVGRQFSMGRKLGKTHQNVLVFVKGDWRKATKACGEVEVFVPEDVEAAAPAPDDALTGLGEVWQG